MSHFSTNKGVFGKCSGAGSALARLPQEPPSARWKVKFGLSIFSLFNSWRVKKTPKSHRGTTQNTAHAAGSARESAFCAIPCARTGSFDCDFRPTCSRRRGLRAGQLGPLPVHASLIPSGRVCCSVYMTIGEKKFRLLLTLAICPIFGREFCDCRMAISQ